MDGFVDDCFSHAAEVFLKKPDNTVRPPPRMLDPSTLEKVFSRETVSGSRGHFICYKILYNDSRLRGYPFIGIENENPRMTALIKSKLLLRPEAPPPGFEKNLTAKRAGNINGIISTTRIHHDNLLCKGNTFQTGRQIFGFVMRYDRYGKG
jgi:hypothetical protein